MVADTTSMITLLIQHLYILLLKTLNLVKLK